MPSRTVRSIFPAFMIVLIAILACNVPAGNSGNPGSQPEDSEVQVSAPPAATDAVVPFTATAGVVHTLTPGAPTNGKVVYDVESQGTAPEKRAPYGDSHRINILERPFLQDMTYVPDLDIVTYTVGQDDTWWYVSIRLIGSDPNTTPGNNTLGENALGLNSLGQNPQGINYGVELDLDHDGFGDYVILARSAHATSWETANVQIFQDKNHDTGGLSGENDDAPITTDGYETRIFNGGSGDADPDMAWARTNGATPASVQFAFKKSWSGTVFMLGVFADAGLRDVGKLDYVDRFTEAEAGSPIKEKIYYPLKALFAVDNACREAFGFTPTGYEPQLCPRSEPTPKPRSTPEDSCHEPFPGYCGSNSYWVDEPWFCGCSPF